jgi:hypothetical protein
LNSAPDTARRTFGHNNPPAPQVKNTNPPVSDSAAEILDLFNREQPPTSVSMADLRRLVEHVEATDPATAATAATTATASTALPIDEIPFGIEVEMEGKPDTYHLTVNQMKYEMFKDGGFKPWNLHPKLHEWKIEKDDSLRWRWSAEAVSPPMNLKEPGSIAGKSKAEEEIEKLLGYCHALEGHTTHKCGLHIHIDARALGEKGLANLFKMCMENENLLFKLSQNGEPVHRGVEAGFGWRHGKKYYYSRPFSAYLPDAFPIKHADSPSELGHALYTMVPQDNPDIKRPPVPDIKDMASFKPDRHDTVRYFGINFNAYWYYGTIEFRLFNASDDPQQVLTDIKLALGIIAAAADGKYAYLHDQPLDVDNPNRAVSSETYNYFMQHVARFPGVRQRLDQTFKSGGGQVVADAPVTDKTVLKTAQLLARGYRFRAQGKAISSPFEVVSELQKGARPVEVVGPNGESQVLSDALALETIRS